jgi:hypothetical protein
MKIQLLGSSSFAEMILEVIITTKYWLGTIKLASLTRNINSAGGQYEYQKRIGMGSSCIQGQWRINPYLI